MNNKCDVLSVMDDVCKNHHNGSTSFDDLRRARAVVAELIEAGTRFDKWDNFETQQRFRESLRRAREPV